MDKYENMTKRDIVVHEALRMVHNRLLGRLLLIVGFFTIIFVLIMWSINRRSIKEVSVTIENVDKNIDTIFTVMKQLAKSDSSMATQLKHFPSSPPLELKNMTKVSSLFQKRIDPISKQSEFHWGLDYSSHKGSRVYASAEGKVEEADWNDGYGRMVKIDHENGYETLYAHLDSIKVIAGQFVFKGEEIGTVGSTGSSTGDHLHYEISFLKNKINPKVFTSTY